MMPTTKKPTQVTVSSLLFNTTSQIAHFSAAAFLNLAVKLHTPHRFALIFALLCVAAAGVKEFWYDEYLETAAERGSSLLDFTMYALGIAGGYFLA